MSNAVLDAAFKRAFIYAGIAATTALGTSLLTDQSPRTIVAYMIAAATPVFLARWQGEGSYDSGRADRGDVNDGDVPEASPKLVVTEVK